MTIRKRKTIDSRDRDILRVLWNNGHFREASGAFIAKKINLTPPAIKPRLINLKNQGIIKQSKCGGLRSFDRKFGNTTKKIKAPSKICWSLNLRKKK